MSKLGFVLGPLISLLCMKAVAGWVSDGIRAETARAELAHQIVSNASAIAGLSTQKLDQGESISMPMDDAAGTNSRWSEWAVAGQTDTNGNWRLGVVNSNFVIQTRGAGGWSNAVMFLKP